MICPNCGQELNDDAVFCISCGKRLAGVSAEEYPESTPEREEKNKAPLIIGLGALAIVLIIGVTCVLLLNPFASGNAAKDTDPFAHLSETSGETIPQGTGAPDETAPDETAPDETEPEAAEPAEIRVIGKTEKGGVGVPLPDVPADILKNAAEKYWQLLSNHSDAESYGLLDLTGDETQELIVRERQSDGTFSYGIYYFDGEDVVQIPCDKIAAGGDERLLSSDGQMIVLYSAGYANTVVIGGQLNAEVSFGQMEHVPEYTSSSALVSAKDRSLLDLHLLGKNKSFSYTGWIRYDSTDYYYRSGKPVTRKWVTEGSMLYYLGESACVTKIAGQSILSDVMEAYFESYQKAFNAKDVSLLEQTTDKNRDAAEKRFLAEENKFLTISELTCDTSVHKGNDKDGSVQVDVHLEYIQCGEWADAKAAPAQKDYRITLVWKDGQWYVDHMGNR